MAWQNNEPRDPNFSQRVQTSFDAQGFMNYVGASIDVIGHGKVNITLPESENLRQQHGFFHGGVIASISDSAAGYAALTTFDADSGILTTEFKINFLNPAKGNFLVARGRVLRPGKTLTVCQADVFNDEEMHVATALLTMARIPGLTN